MNGNKQDNRIKEQRISKKAELKSTQTKKKRVDYRDVYINPYKLEQAKKADIRSQAPSVRRKEIAEKREGLRHGEVRRGGKISQGYKIKRKAEVRRAFAIKAAIFAVILIVLSLASLLAFYLNLKSGDPESYNTIRVAFYDDNEEEPKGTGKSWEKYIRDGKLYINMSEVAEQYGFTTTGDASELRFVAGGNKDEYVRMVLGTYVVTVNGIQVQLSGRIINDNGEIFVPADFFEDYVTGMKINYDEEEVKLHIVRETYSDQYGMHTRQPITFVLKQCKSTNNIDEESLPQIVKDVTYFQSVVVTPGTDDQGAASDVG